MPQSIATQQIVLARCFAPGRKTFFNFFGKGSEETGTVSSSALCLTDQRRFAMTHLVGNEMNPVPTITIDRLGQMTRKPMDRSREAQLINSLLRSLFKDIRVIIVEVPTEPLDPCEHAMVEQALTQLQLDGVRYSLIGASGSAKEGRFYAVESKFEKLLAERFKCSPQAAMTYLGILVSSCRVMIEEPKSRILVVDDHEFGTNDCRGWISHSIFRKLRERHVEELTEREIRKRIAA